MPLLLAAALFTLGEFNFQLPAGWRMQPVLNGYHATGPGAAAMRIEVYAIRGGTADAGGQSAARKIRDAATEAVSRAARKNSLVDQLPLRTKQVNGGRLDESLYTTAQ